MAITTNDKNLGHATAYAYAKSKGYTGTEEEFAELMASYATVAESAEESRQAAEAAQGKAEDAQAAAETAQGIAVQAKDTAVGAKDTAVSAATTATTKAGEASASATSASDSATSAAGSASSAASSASAASGSAATATTKAGEASNSATAATAAQEASENAQEAAEAAAASVSASAAQIGTNTADISELKSDINGIIERNTMQYDVSQIPGVTKLSGVSFSITPAATGAVVGNEMAAYDSYYFYTDSDTAAYFESASLTPPSYLAITVGYNPSKEWTTIAGGAYSMWCEASLRNRNTEANLPTESEPLDVSDAIVCITVPANSTASIYINLALAIRDNVLLPLAQTSGQDTTKAMSQKATTDAIANANEYVYGEIVDVTEQAKIIEGASALDTYNGYVASYGGIVEEGNYITYVFKFTEDMEIYTTDAIAEGESPYLGYAVFRGREISSSNLVSWTRNYNSTTVMPTKNNKLSVTASQYLAVTLLSTALSTYTYYDAPIKYLNPEINVEFQGKKKGKVKYYSPNGLYIACPVNKGYVVYDFNRYTNQASNADGWGINIAYLYDDELSVSSAVALTTSGEWECAVHLSNRPDFSGLRAHGSEVYSNIRFLIDGVYYSEADIANIDEWTDFESIIIYETSKLYDPNDEVTEIADHWKKYTWDGARLDIEQKLTWLINDTTTSCYLAMFPVAKAVTNQFIDNTNFVFEDISSGTPAYNSSDCKSVTLYSSGEQSADVCATFGIELYDASGTDYHSFLLTDNNGGAYNKCYYGIGTNKPISVDEIWKTHSFYEWQI